MTGSYNTFYERDVLFSYVRSFTSNSAYGDRTIARICVDPSSFAAFQDDLSTSSPTSSAPKLDTWSPIFNRPWQLSTPILIPRHGQERKSRVHLNTFERDVFLLWDTFLPNGSRPDNSDLVWASIIDGKRNQNRGGNLGETSTGWWCRRLLLLAK